MGEYDNIFGSIARSKPINNFASRLGLGKHRVALKAFRVKQSQKGQGPILEADFTILESTTHQPGETRGWAWFISAQGWAGTYEEARAKEFIGTVGACVGDTRDVQAVGSDLADKAQPGRGITLDVEISPQTNRDGSPKQNAKGETYTNATWMAVKQDGAQIASTRTTLDQLDASGAAPQPQNEPYRGHGGSGMGQFIGGGTGGVGSAQPSSQAQQPAGAGNTPLTALLGSLKRP